MGFLLAASRLELQLINLIVADLLFVLVMIQCLSSKESAKNKYDTMVLLLREDEY